MVELFVTKMRNGWKLLLTVVTKSFVLNVTGFPDVTLKRIYKFRLRKKSISSGFNKFKISQKNTGTKCQIYSKLTAKTAHVSCLYY